MAKQGRTFFRAVVLKDWHESYLQFDVRLKKIAFCDVKPNLSTFPWRTCDVLSVFHFKLKKQDMKK